MNKIKIRESRRYKTYLYTKKQQTIAINLSLNPNDTVRPLGYYKKRAHMDCGRPQCGLCGNPRKSKKTNEKLTIQEKISDISFSEFIKNI